MVSRASNGRLRQEYYLLLFNPIMSRSQCKGVSQHPPVGAHAGGSDFSDCVPYFQFSQGQNVTIPDEGQR